MKPSALVTDSDSEEYGFSDDDDEVVHEGENEDLSADENVPDEAVAVAGGAPDTNVHVKQVKDKEKKKDRESSGKSSRENEGLTAGMRVKASGNRDRNAPRSAAGGTGLMAEINTIRAELPNEGYT